MQTRRQIAFAIKSVERSSVSIPITVFVMAFLLRVLAIPASLAGLNTYTLTDAMGFAAIAAYLADGLLSGALLTEGSAYLAEAPNASSATYQRWGGILAVFWLIPGPSIVYATLFVAMLGAGAAYNTARIAEVLHSPRAGLAAGVPMALYPSHIAIQTALLREAAVLFGLTAAALLLVMHAPEWTVQTIGFSTLLGVGGAIWFVGLLRPQNLPVIMVGVATAVFYRCVRQYLTDREIVGVIGGGLIGGVAMIPYIGPIRQMFAQYQYSRHKGRTAYLGGLEFQTAVDILVAVPITTFYFLFTPLPWMIETAIDVLGFAEVLVTMGMAAAAIIGARQTFDRHPTVVIALCTAFVFAVICYGLGTVNAGTAMRHRHSFLWVLFIFGGIAAAQWLDGELPELSPRDKPR